MSTATAEVKKREIGEKVKLTLPLEAASTKDLGEGVFEATITTNEVDRHLETIDTEGIDTSNYMKNPVVLYGHDYEGLPIGKTLKLAEMKSKIKARFQLAVKEYPFASTVADMIAGGYLGAVSIGGVVKQWSDDYQTIEKMEMVEFSIVPVPANPSALITSRSLEEATGKTQSQVAKEYHDFVQRNLVDKVKHLPDDEINQAIKSLENLLAALKDAAQAASSAGEADTPKSIRRIKHITLRDTAKAVATQSQRVIRTIKLAKENSNNERES